MTSASLNGI